MHKRYRRAIIHRTYTKSLKKIFGNCSELKTIDFQQFNTKSCMDFSLMFFYCPKLKDLKVDKFYTKNIRDMDSLFE